MNLASPWSVFSKFIFRVLLKYKRRLPQKRSTTFGVCSNKEYPTIEHIYFINLERQIERFALMKQELSYLLDNTGKNLWDRTERFAAIDAKDFIDEPQKNEIIDPIYSLRDQLFVEPQPLTFPTKVDLDTPIRMSRPEIAVARSHIEVWRQILVSNYEYALILEDDVWFKPGFATNLDHAWTEIKTQSNKESCFDILYLSYEEIKNGAPKTFISRSVFRPERGLWFLSGYIISRKGVEKLLSLLPCRGPIDLWINHQFKFLEVLAIRKSIICQRGDLSSTNSYSILPSLTKIGAINSESASLFHIYPTERPVFAFGTKDSGLTSLAMALSMLGYRCCSDLDTIPITELQKLIDGNNYRIFDAYVNIGVIETKIIELFRLYPQAKFIITKRELDILNDNLKFLINHIGKYDVVIVDFEIPDKWQVVCKHLRCAPPVCSYPELADLGQKELSIEQDLKNIELKCEVKKRDKSPWVIEPNNLWQGIQTIKKHDSLKSETTPISINDNLKFIDEKYWFLRDDTFTDNLALFRPSNIEFINELGISLNLKQESLGVRKYSAAALTSSNKYLYGKFEALIKASDAPGVVTGIFLHRNSPRQEIDIEITGNRPKQLLVNVFYNPGTDGSKFDYGYRGTVSAIDLGFDTSKDYHLYTIEWDENEIRWLVDNQLVHKRIEWSPTPIPHLPMSFHVNLWPTRSMEFAGKINNSRIPTYAYIKSLNVTANQI